MLACCAHTADWQIGMKAAHDVYISPRVIAQGVLDDPVWLMGAVNRFSYGAFHAARSLLATRQADSPRHTGAIDCGRLSRRLNGRGRA